MDMVEHCHVGLAGWFPPVLVALIKFFDSFFAGRRGLAHPDKGRAESVGAS